MVEQNKTGSESMDEALNLDMEGNPQASQERIDKDILAFIEQSEEAWAKRKKRKVTQRVCISGGAQGADFLWSSTAITAGFDVKIMSFAGHSVVAHQGARVIRLEAKSLQEANSMLEQAGRAMNRKLPSPSSYTMKLLQRNWWIVKDADAVIAVSRFERNGKSLGVEGGTAWGCEMYWLARKQNITVALFLYDMTSSSWFQITNQGSWEKCNPPSLVLYSRIAMIGSRALTRPGQAAVETVFQSFRAECE